MKYFIGNNLFNYTDTEFCTVEFCLSYLKDKKKLGLDIETSRKFNKNQYKESVYQPGLDPYLSRVIMLQIGDLDNQFMIDTRVISPMFLRSILEDNSILKVGHNLKFEGKHLFHSYGIKLYHVWDTMICERILYNGNKLSYSLEALSYRYLDSKKIESQTDMFSFEEDVMDYEDSNILDLMDSKFSFVIDKSIRMDFVELEDKPFTQKQIDYACDDILMPLLIQEKQEQGRLVNDSIYNPTMGFFIENKFTQTLALIELKGVKVNAMGWMNLYEENLKHRKKLKKLLDDFVLIHHTEYKSMPDLFMNDFYCTLQWESSTQVVKLFKKLGCCPKEFSKQTKRVEYTVGAKSVFKLLTNENKDLFYKDEFIELKSDDNNQSLMLLYLIYKKYQLLTTTFGKEWLEYIHPITGKVHTSFKQLLNTGRMASVSPNLQQLPKGKEWRSLFISDEGYSLGAIDYSAQEGKVASEVHKEPAMQDFFINGHPIHKDDIHCFVASSMFSILRNQPDLIITKKEKKERNIAKALGFKILYGGGAYTISQDLGIDIKEAEEFVAAYFKSFPGLLSSFEVAKKEAVKNGYITICKFTDKRFFFPEFDKMNEIYKEAFSYFGDDYKKLTTTQKANYKKELYLNNPGIKPLFSKAGKLKGKLERAALNYPECMGLITVML